MIDDTVMFWLGVLAFWSASLWAIVWFTRGIYRELQEKERQLERMLNDEEESMPPKTGENI